MTASSVSVLLLFIYYVNGEFNQFIHLEQGVMSSPPLSSDIEFDSNDPIASSLDMMSFIQSIYDRNVRRGLSNPSTFDDTDRQIMLDLHNKIRSETARGLYPSQSGGYQPKSCNMNALSWSAALEKLATDWSSQCYFEHSSGCNSRMTSIVNNGKAAGWDFESSNGCGENLYVSGAEPEMNAVFGDKNYGICGGIEDGWSREEAAKYTYQAGFNYAAGHYTQVVWANTRYVGCGFRQCNGIKTKSSNYDWGKLMFTCNYYPPGNYGNQYPYKQGTPCSCCDSDRKACTHDNGLCGGGWNSRWNKNGASDTTSVDVCYDGTGRNVCDENGQPNPTPKPTSTPKPTAPNPIPTPKPTEIIYTPSPTTKPSPNPSNMPTGKPSPGPTITRIANPTLSPNSGQSTPTTYAVRVSTEVIWLTYQYDYSNVASSIEDLMFQLLSEPYLGLTSSEVDISGKNKQGPYCANPCYYIYGFNTVPMILRGATEQQKDIIISSVNSGEYADSLCSKLTALYKTADDNGLRCYRVTATVESITASEYQKFIGDLDNDGVPFDTFNLESYSGADIFVLLIFLSFICCICWCIGWYSHKKKFQKELERELELASNFNVQTVQTDITRKMAANTSPDLFEKGIGRFRKN